MSNKKKERIKIYIVIGLSLILVTLGYFSFIHKKSTPDDDHNPLTPPSAIFDVTKLETAKPQSDYWHILFADEPINTIRRDIFAPLKSLKEVKKGSSEHRSSKPTPTFKLKGTIIGGGNSIAIINDRFVRIGDRIGEYKLVRIGKKGVLLSSSNKIIELEMLKYEW